VYIRVYLWLISLLFQTENKKLFSIRLRFGEFVRLFAFFDSSPPGNAKFSQSKKEN